jgi:hypothetical protein
MTNHAGVSRLRGSRRQAGGDHETTPSAYELIEGSADEIGGLATQAGQNADDYP